jgi:hypothetical protein
LPWGDPVPPVIDAVSSSLLERPSATLSNRIDDYVSLLAGGVVLLAGGLVAAVANRRAAIAAGATALSVLLWAAGPVSGASPRIEFADIALSAVRYLLPALACGATALALATLGRRRANDPFAIGAAVVLAGALVWGIVRDAQLGFPTVPGVETLVAGAVIGALVAWLLGWLIVRIPLVATALFAALVLALAAHNYLFHHAEASRSFDQDISRFLAAQPDYADGDAPVAAAPTMAGPLAGDRVTHRLTLIRPDTPCATVRKVAREGYVLLRAAVSVEFRGGVIYPAPITAWRCFAGRQPVFAHNGASIYTLR